VNCLPLSTAKVAILGGGTVGCTVFDSHQAEKFYLQLRSKLLYAPLNLYEILMLESSNGAWNMALAINLQLPTLEMNRLLC